MSRIVQRAVSSAARERLEAEGVHPLLARVFAGRGVRGRGELDYALESLVAPARLKGAEDAAQLLAYAVARRQRILIIADYDCDGATACAVGLRALRAMGAEVSYLVPNRFDYGYGLTPEIVRLAAERRPELIVTVDNGIASLEGVAQARRLGIATLITDHHLPGPELPEAHAIVNPNQPGCEFPSKSLAGVGVMFYVALAARAELRRRGYFAGRTEPNLAGLLDLVALGTVADVVRLDRNNRILVAHGLARIRAGRAQPGIGALLHAAGRDPAQASTFDLGFAVGPRINAAGRLADMGTGIECLISDDYARGARLAGELDALNRERRIIESDMRDQAEAMLERLDIGNRLSVTLFDPGWHQGVVGLLASRVKERIGRPVIAFARSADGELRGSGRSIDGVHLRDVLDLVSKRHPGLLRRFGGHAAAAGLTLSEADLERFDGALEEAVAAHADPSSFARQIESDGPVESAYCSLEVARRIGAEVWGQGFPAPLFDDVFEVTGQRLLKEKHLKLTLARGASRLEAIWFNHADPLPERARIAYRLAANEFGGLARVELMVEHAEPLTAAAGH